jgi:hypothetical protein
LALGLLWQVARALLFLGGNCLLSLGVGRDDIFWIAAVFQGREVAQEIQVINQADFPAAFLFEEARFNGRPVLVVSAWPGQQIQGASR